MKKKEDEADNVVVLKELPIGAQDVFGTMGSADQSFSRAQSAFIRQAMTTSKVSLVENVRDHTRGALDNIILCRLEEDSFEGDKILVDFVRRIVRSNMMSSRWTKKVRNAAKDAVGIRRRNQTYCRRSCSIGPVHDADLRLCKCSGVSPLTDRAGRKKGYAQSRKPPDRRKRKSLESTWILIFQKT